MLFYAKKLTGYELESFPYASIASFEAGKNMMGRYFRFVASGNDVKLKWINGGDVDQFAAIVRGRAGSHRAAAAAPAAASSLADELAKLGELLRQGLLTQQEFDAQKARLLAG